eukprot:TRINITY_DN6100_c0_g4_i1.p1 TRINITY_DN6100_c0_g4~~TRINITY_DN6100_c0_g4_i1.p1  ORF type:complete len:987 (-),score=273.95 TRINITY_DN6100_c0_g4_i1:1004-3964(-)
MDKSSSREKDGGWRVFGGEIMAGGVNSLNNAFTAVSMASVFYYDLLENESTNGTRQLLIGFAVSQLIYALFSKLDIMAPAVSFEAAPFATIMCDNLFKKMADKPTSEVLSTVIFGYVAITLLSGIALYLVGSLKLGGIVNFFPYPVKAGVFCSIGYSLYVYSYDLATDRTLNLDNLSDNAWLLIIAHIVGIGLFAVTMKWGHPMTLSALFVGGTILAQIIRLATGRSNDEAREDMWLVEKADTGFGWDLYSAASHKVHFDLLLEEAGTIAMAVMIGPLLNGTIASALLGPMLQKQVKQDHELKVQGASNLLSGIFGGFPSNAGLVPTLLVRDAGGKTKISTLACSVFTFLFFLVPWGLELQQFLPRAVISALFINFGLCFVWSSIIEPFQQLKWTEIAIIAIIVACTFVKDISVGLIVGICLAFIFFISRYSKVDHVAFEADNTEVQSCAIRSWEHVRKLEEEVGEQVYIFRLQGYMFFASGSSVTRRIEQVVNERLESGIKTRYILLDFQQVPGMDTTSMITFLDFFNHLRNVYGIRVCLILHTTSNVLKDLENIRLDEANIRKQFVEENIVDPRPFSEVGSFAIMAGQSTPLHQHSSANSTPPTSKWDFPVEELNEQEEDDMEANGIDATSIKFDTNSDLTDEGRERVSTIATQFTMKSGIYGNPDSSDFNVLTKLQMAANEVAHKKAKETGCGIEFPMLSSLSPKNRARRHSFKAFASKKVATKKVFKVFHSFDSALEYCEDALLGIRNEHLRATLTDTLLADPILSAEPSAFEKMKYFAKLLAFEPVGFVFGGLCPLLDTGLLRFKHLQAGQVLFWEGQPIDGIYILLDGRLTSYFTPQSSIDTNDLMPKQGNVTLLDLSPFSKSVLWIARDLGTPIGRFNSTSETNYSEETVVANVDSMVLHISQQALDEVSITCPSASVELLSQVKLLNERKMRYLKMQLKFTRLHYNHGVASSGSSVDQVFPNSGTKNRRFTMPNVIGI